MVDGSLPLTSLLPFSLSPTVYILLTIYMLFPKPIECVTPRMNSDVNYGLWVIKICQHKYINCNKCWMLIVGEDVGEGVSGNPVLSAQFCSEPKTA